MRTDGMRSMLRIGLLAVLAAVMAGCGPRGETKSLDEVLSIARARYDYVKNADVSADVRTTLNKLNGNLSELVKTPAQASAKSQDTAQLLNSLGTRAAYTTRPALAELVMQYRLLNEAKDSKEDAAKVRLLVSRTYHLLAAELETTKFGVG